MDELLQQLKTDFADFSCYSDDGCLRMGSNWKGRTDGIKEIRLYLTGIHPLTGKQLNKDFYTISIDRLTPFPLVSAPLQLYGDYKLHFEAIDMDGNNLGSFREPECLTIENKKLTPYCEYSISSAYRDWEKVELKTNCWERYRGSVWVKSGGRLYPLLGDEKVARRIAFYFPKGSIEPPFCSDEQLPPLREGKS